MSLFSGFTTLTKYSNYHNLLFTVQEDVKPLFRKESGHNQ